MTEQQKEEILLSIHEKVGKQDGQLNDISKKLTSHDEQFKKMWEKLESHDEQFQKIWEKLSEHDEQFKIMNEKIEARDNLLITIVRELASLKNEMNSRFENIEKELERQRQNMARMENDLLDKITLLFDMSKINKEKFSEQDKKMKEIRRVLDWHDSRIFQLETK